MTKGISKGLFKRRYSLFWCLVAFLFVLLLTAAWYCFLYVESYSVCNWKSPEDAKKPFPKIVHRIWFQSRDFPWKYRRNWDHCKAINPQYEFILWSHEEIEAFLSKDYPWLMPVYEKYLYFVLQTDLARYTILYHFGGVYIDMDLDCRVPFDVIINNTVEEKDYGVILGAGRPIGIGNSFMAAKTRHPFYKVMIDNLGSHQGHYLTPYWTVMLSAGTLYVAKIYLKYPCTGQVIIISASLHNDIYLQHQHDSSWHQADGRFFIWIGQHLTIIPIVIILSIVVTRMWLRKK